MCSQGHFKKDFPKLKNGNRGNQRGNGNAPAKVYVVGNAGTNPDSKVVTADGEQSFPLPGIVDGNYMDPVFIRRFYFRLANRFSQLRVREEDIPKTAFRTQLWSLRVPSDAFGLTMHVRQEEYEEHLKAILELLKKEELYAKFSKCEFWIPKVTILGLVINSQGHSVDSAKN
ncbi:hypothetical protein Tco_1193130 [Tanacetum coccineum]